MTRVVLGYWPRRIPVGDADTFVVDYYSQTIFRGAASVRFQRAIFKLAAMLITTAASQRIVSKQEFETALFGDALDGGPDGNAFGHRLFFARRGLGEVGVNVETHYGRGCIAVVLPMIERAAA